MVSSSQNFHPSAEQNARWIQGTFEKALDEGRITEDDRELIETFLNDISVRNDISPAREKKIAIHLVTWRRFIGPYRENTYNDLVKGVRALKAADSERGTPYKQNTIRDFISFLKRFYLWLGEEGINEIPEKKIRDIKPPGRDTMTKTAGDLLTPEEIQKIISVCTSSRDRALISLLYEGAFRIGEVGTLTWQQVKMSKDSLIISTNFKTGKPRRIRLAACLPYLATWKDDYPGEITPDKMVFVTLVNNSPREENKPGRTINKPLSYPGVSKQIKTLCKRAGIERKITPHIFRHSRITHLIQKGYSESYIKMVCWGSLRTDMMATYLHLTDKDIDKEFYMMEGLVSPEELEDDRAKGLNPVQCPRCASINAGTSKFCRSCGLELTSEAIAEKKELVEGLNSLSKEQIMDLLSQALGNSSDTDSV